MDTQAISQKISQLYSTDKGKGFITHLLRAFLPVDKSFFLMSPDGRKQVCCLTNEKLSTKEEKIKQAMPLAGDMLRNTAASMQAVANGQEHEMDAELKNKLESIQSMSMAVVCEKSDKMLSQNALQALLDFYCTQIVLGNQNLSRVAKKEQAKQGIKSMQENGMNLNKQEKRVLMKTATLEGSSGGLSLGDITALQQLSDKFKKQGK